MQKLGNFAHKGCKLLQFEFNFASTKTLYKFLGKQGIKIITSNILQSKIFRSMRNSDLSCLGKIYLPGAKPFIFSIVVFTSF